MKKFALLFSLAIVLIATQNTFANIGDGRQNSHFGKHKSRNGLHSQKIGWFQRMQCVQVKRHRQAQGLVFN